MRIEAAVREARTVEAKLDIIARELDVIALRLGQTKGLPRAQPATGISPIGNRHLESADVRRIYQHWAATMGKRPNTKLTPERRRCIQARLKQGYSVDDCLRAIDGCATSDFHMARGQHAGGTKYNDLTLIFRNGANVEKFGEMAGLSPDEKRKAFL